MTTKRIGELEWRFCPNRAAWGHAVTLPDSEDGWRLPTVAELVSLWSYRYNQCFHFPNPNERRWFWAAEDASPGEAWSVGFGDGSVMPRPKDEINLVRLVRRVGVES